MSEPWWGEHLVPSGKIACWRIGPTTVYIQRLTDEWRIARVTVDAPFASDLKVENPCGDLADLLPLDDVTRFSLEDGHDTITLTPLLADRPVISRPERPFVLPAGQSATLYVSSPLWLRVEAGPQRRLLTEFPIFRPSDTWFGPSTLDGTLCYASRAFFTLRLQRLPVRPHRAVTGVRLENRATSPLEVRHLNLPLPHLRLYARQDGTLWTDEVVFARTATGDFVEFAAGARWRTAPAQAELTCEARAELRAGTVFHAFSSIFHHRAG